MKVLSNPIENISLGLKLVLAFRNYGDSEIHHLELLFCCLFPSDLIPSCISFSSVIFFQNGTPEIIPVLFID